jgi:tetratricopeptide (TPR) repeat protein
MKSKSFISRSFISALMAIMTSSICASANPRESVEQKAKATKLKTFIAEQSRKLRLNANDFDALYQRGRAYNDLGHHENAIRDFTKCIRLSPDCLDCRSFRAQSYIDIHQDERAIKDYTKLISTDPDNPIWYIYRSDCQLALGKIKKSIEDLTQSIEIEPTQSAYSWRAEAYSKLGRNDLAKQDYIKRDSLPEDRSKDANQKFAKSQDCAPRRRYVGTFVFDKNLKEWFPK